MTDDFAVAGQEGGYVPCFELPSALVVEEEGAISGQAGGRVPRDNAPGALPAPERAAIVGSGVGFVAKPCEEEGCPGLGCTTQTLRGFWINDVGYLGQSDPVFGPPLYGQWTQCNADDREWRTYCAIAEVTDSGKPATIDLGLVTGMSEHYASCQGAGNTWAGASVAWELRGGVWDTDADGDVPFDIPGYTVLASGDEPEDTFVNFAVNNGDCTAGAGQTAYRTVPTISFNIPTLINDQQYWVYLVATSTETGYFLPSIEDPAIGVTSIESRGDTSKQLTSWVSASMANHVGEINSTYTLCEEIECAELMIVGNSGSIVVSVDGVGWFWQTSSFGSSSIFDAVYSQALNLWVAVGAGSPAKIATSPDGVTWTQRTSPYPIPGLGATTIFAVAWAPAVGMFVTGASHGIAWSTDGISWTLTSSTPSNINDIVWSPELGLFVAVGAAGGICTSPDGVAWTTQTSATIQALHGVCWSPELDLFVAVGDTGDIVSSPDGVTWTAETSFTAVDSLKGIAWSAENGRFVVVGGWTAVGVSTDGHSWSTDATGLLGGGGAPVNDVKWSSGLGLFIMVGNNSGSGSQTSRAATSADGLTWAYANDVTSELGTTSLQSVAVANRS